MTTQELIDRVKNLPGLRSVAIRRYERYFAQERNANLFRGVFRTFADAAASAPLSKGVGYDQPEPAAMYRDGLGMLWPSDYAALYWLNRSLPEISSVFDYGGHVGVKYYAFRRYLELGERVDWTVCDVPAVAASGQKLAAEKGEHKLHFTSDFLEVSGKSVLFCSGSLQYIEPSLPQLLSKVGQLPPQVLINSTPISTAETYYTLNNIGTAFCPYKIQNLDELVSGMKALRYELVDSWENPGKRCLIPLHPEHSLDHYRGLYFKLIDSSMR